MWALIPLVNRDLVTTYFFIRYTKVMEFTYIIHFLVSGAICYYAIPAIIRFAEQTNQYASTSARMSHSKDIPNLGGVGIFLGVIISTLLITDNSVFPALQYLLLAQVIIFFLGLKDDIFVLSPSKKLIIQVACAFVVVVFAGVRIDNFYGVLGIREIGEIESIIISMFIVVGIINSFNLVDGIDWLAGLICLSSVGFLAYWFHINGFQAQAGLCYSVLGATISYLYYNKTPAKVFMGDAGSLFLGLSICYLTIDFINLNHTTPNLTYQLRSGPLMGISILFIPILDTLRVFFIRLKSRKSPFSPDRNHLHHILIDSKLSHIQSALVLFCINMFAIGTTVSLNFITGKILVPILFLVSFTVVNLFTFNKIKKKKVKLTRIAS